MKATLTEIQRLPSALRELGKGLLASNFDSLVRLLGYRDNRPFISGPRSLQGNEYAGNVAPEVQWLLARTYKEMAERGSPLPSLHEVGFQSLSQYGEDGVLLFLFSILGTTNKRCVEICAGDGIQCNTANLIVNHGWRGLLFDGSAENVAAGKAFYAGREEVSDITVPQSVQAWVTAENVDGLIREHGFAGEIDLLSVDIDGIDYWLWKAVECIQPRVVVLEYNQCLGIDHAVTIPNLPNFVYDWDRPHFGGASLPAFVKLGREKGYRLVGNEKTGVNAFFLRSGVGEAQFPEVPVESFLTLNAPESAWRKKYPWVEV